MSLQTEHRTKNGSPPPVVEGVFSASGASEIRRFKAILHDRLKLKRLHSEVIKYTPAVAEYIIANLNTRNRAVTKSKVKEYTQAVKRGEFQVTSQSVAFCEDGTLGNGQHRMLAVIEAGMPAEFYTTFGDKVSAFAVMDALKPRTGPDALHIAGRKNALILAAAARLISVIESNSRTLTNQQILDIVDKHEGLEDATFPARRLITKFKCAGAAPTVAMYLIATKSAYHARRDDFVDSLISGNNLSKNAPLLKLRDGLFTKSITAQYHRQEDKSYVLCATIINTWNKWIRGERGSIAFDIACEFPVVE